MPKGNFPKRSSRRVQQATLCLLIRERRGTKEVCLAMKKRGFGQGLWNGVGGKTKEGETPKVAFFREAFEEIGVHVRKTRKIALLHFYFPDDPKKKDWNQDVHVFLAQMWKGEPKETEEMRPQWFKLDEVPFNKMWADDLLWLPRVFAGELIEGWFSFDDNNQVLDFKIKNVEEGGRTSTKR